MREREKMKGEKNGREGRVVVEIWAKMLTR